MQEHEAKCIDKGTFQTREIRFRSGAGAEGEDEGRATQEWRTAMEALILVADLGGPTMFTRIGIMRVLNRHVERVFNP